MSPDLDQVKELHARILDAWNRQDAAGYAEQFTETALIVGFDGSEMHGRDGVAAQLDAIFSDHEVASYVRIVREVRGLGDGAALLHAVVGIVPPGGGDLMPDRNAVQVLIAVRVGEGWLAEIFHNTPARLDGRPEALEALTDELRAAREAD
jgi:uncharacterized protein (TIGR02246 family)